jgi:hypothetical protein
MSTASVKSGWRDWRVVDVDNARWKSHDLFPQAACVDIQTIEPSEFEEAQRSPRTGSSLSALQGCDVSYLWRSYSHEWKGFLKHFKDVISTDCDVHFNNIVVRYSGCALLDAELSRRIVSTLREVKSIMEETPNARKFRRLADQWYNETGMLSMIHKKVMHPAYQRIIGMGKEALPFIFQELNKKHVHWIWALSAILDDDVAKPEDTLEEAVAAWLKWGKDNGYI